MPSRKRAKGKERKLKQQAREPVERSVSRAPPNDGNINLPEQSIRRIEQAKNMKCRHGYVHNHQGHPVTDFLDSFIETLNSDVSITHCMEMTFEKHREVWKDSTLRKMAIDTMVSMGTGMIIDEYIEFARHVWRAIILLEQYDGEGPFQSVLSKAMEDFTYLSDAEDRDVIHFYKKRITCSCLDKMYSIIKKSQVRGSTCSHCKQTVKRKDLKTCSRCKLAQYCSKECQKLDWPSHKEHCMEFADFHKVANMVGGIEKIFNTATSYLVAFKIGKASFPPRGY